MAEQIYKLSPHRDLQCYFLTPSAIASMSQASASGFTVSGKWRQQFDWCVVEWNRDNVFEHPALRYLPDGDLSGLTLSYQETRTNCIPIESNLDPIVDWSNLRIWATDDSGVENLYHVDFSLSNATPVGGSYVAATATMVLTASPGVGNRVGLALLENHHYYVVQTGDTLADIAQGVATAVNGNADIIGNPDFMATVQSDGVSIQLTPRPGDTYSAVIGANCNRVTVYGFAQNAAVCWQQPAVMFSGGAFPTTYQITVNFGNLVDSVTGAQIPTSRVRKLRWTWAADMQPGSYQQSEFQVVISNWSVTGSNREYSVAGPGSRRIEDSDPFVNYSGSAWAISTGNYSGSKIHSTNNIGDSCTIVYIETAAHNLYLGTRLLASGATVNVSIDGQTTSLNLLLNGEDVLVRSPLG